MTITAEDLIETARELLAGSREVDWRNATSRAYYGAFHHCRSLARADGLETSFVGHVGLIEVLRRRPQLRAIAYMLNLGRLQRQIADYELERPFGRDLAESAVSNCERLMVKVDQHSAQPQSVSPG